MSSAGEAVPLVRVPVLPAWAPVLLSTVDVSLSEAPSGSEIARRDRIVPRSRVIIEVAKLLLWFACSRFESRSELAAESPALRHRLNVPRERRQGACGFGRGADRPLSWSDPGPWVAGTGAALSLSGAGSLEVLLKGQGMPMRSEISSLTSASQSAFGARL